MEGQEYRDRIKAELGMFSSGPQTTSQGSFSFTEPDIRKVISNWIAIAKTYDDSLDKVIRLARVEGPGLDFASRSFAAKANQSGESLIQHLQHGRQYSMEQAQLAQNALDDYLGVEHTNVADLYKAQQGAGTEV